MIFDLHYYLIRFFEREFEYKHSKERAKKLMEYINQCIDNEMKAKHIIVDSKMVTPEQQENIYESLRLLKSIIN
ncbi:MAG: hypothetical protein R3321_00430 [Nitrososphaeraceae archaeon]|nr:hypothetical protein [Nitrososphaeraceae archaeon]